MSRGRHVSSLHSLRGKRRKSTRTEHGLGQAEGQAERPGLQAWQLGTGRLHSQGGAAAGVGGAPDPGEGLMAYAFSFQPVTDLASPPLPAVPFSLCPPLPLPLALSLPLPPPLPSLLLILGSWKNTASKPGCRRSVLVISVTSRTFWEEMKVML